MTDTILYLIPRTAVLGAVLLTGHLGGAAATHVSAGQDCSKSSFPSCSALRERPLLRGLASTATRQLGDYPWEKLGVDIYMTNGYALMHEDDN
ncbi:DoxX family protein [Candidatus Nitrospira nitrificans]|uniref:DoxX family protein n=1 Tax=Candidatus Nitrospira nitrificans TaxID=1742973 RepID=UPI001C2F13A8|nr:DoxX family protein [Candidatus Nitrospira nitrificans]